MVANNELLKEIRVMAVKLEEVTDTLNNLEQKMDKEVLDINNEIDEIRTQFTNAMLEVKNELDQEIRKIYEKFNDIKCANKNLELSISGIPATLGENLYLIISKISTLISFEEMNFIVGTHRLEATHTTSTSSVSNIIVSFATTRSRRQFMSKYFSYIKINPLKLAHIGMNSQCRIYINENLSKECLELLKLAKSLKKSGNIANVYIYDGQVCVFHRANDNRFEIILNADDLKKYE